MPSMIATQDAYIADLRRCENVTRRYGNQRAALGAAYRKRLAELTSRGWPEADAKGVLKQAKEVFELERDCDDA